ncbi:hypothetical protein [Aliihoeflea sp. PC F10.4]
MPRRGKPIKITAERVELYLDKLAEIMDRIGDRAHLAVPLWKRLERERDRLRDEEDVLAAARARLKRSTDRREVRSA